MPIFVWICRFFFVLSCFFYFCMSKKHYICNSIITKQKYYVI